MEFPSKPHLVATLDGLDPATTLFIVASKTFSTLETLTNARLARVVDRLRALIVAWEHDAPDRNERDTQIRRHRHRSALVLRACRLLYAALACFIGTSLALAADALLGFPFVGAVPTVLAVAGMACLLGASLTMGREVSLSVRSFDEELDQELARKRS